MASFEQETKLPITDEEQEKLEQELLAQRDAAQLTACSLEEMILSYFPARCAAPLKDWSKTPPQAGPVVASGMSDVRLRIAMIPTDDSFIARSVREHEAAHLNLTKGKPQSMAEQAAEDGIIETFRRHSPVTRAWVIANGLWDVRGGSKYLLHPERYMVPPQLVEMTRHVSFVEVFRGWCRIIHHEVYDARHQVARRLASRILHRLGDAGVDVGLLAAAATLIRRTRSVHGYHPSPLILKRLRKRVAKVLAPLFQTEPPKPRPLPPPVSRGREMPVQTLDLTADGNVRQVLAEVHENKRAGIRLRANVLVSAALSPETAKPFVRTEKLPGASVLIDASGSMSLTSVAITRLIAAYPASTVAYYLAGGGQGYMVLCAKDGRVTTKKQLPYVGEFSGNEIDYTALVWLLRQDAPRYFITDGGFCGGLAASAKRLFQLAIQEKKITWIARTDVDEAIKEVQGK